MSGASLNRVYFGDANLMEANLQDADLRYAGFYYARMITANLKNANLYEADFSHAVVSDEQLAEAYRLYGATMPLGQRYDGRFNLKGDLEEAERKGIDIDDPDQMRRWYQGDISVLLGGQPQELDWYDALEEDELEDVEYLDEAFVDDDPADEFDFS
jgi:hypothetical protein